MDSLTSFSLASSLVALISSTYTAFALAREWYRRNEIASDMLHIHKREIQVLADVVQESFASLNTGLVLPQSVLVAFRNCEERQKDLETMIASAGIKHDLQERQYDSWKVILRISVRHREFERSYKKFKEDALLLRDLCSELRSQQQLVELRAGIARLMYDFTTEPDDEVRLDQFGIENNKPSTAGLEKTTFQDRTMPDKTLAARRRQQTVVNALSQLSQSNYVVNATIAIPARADHADGGIDGHYHHELIHLPALVKLDTGSDVDVVSKELLQEAGFDQERLQEIPCEEADILVTFDGVEFQPKSKVSLSWYMEGELRMRRNTFYVVPGAPIDLLLGSKRFATEAARHVGLFARVKQSKADETRRKQLEEALVKQRQKEALENEQRAFEEAKRIREAASERILPR